MSEAKRIPGAPKEKGDYWIKSTWGGLEEAKVYAGFNPKSYSAEFLNSIQWHSPIAPPPEEEKPKHAPLPWRTVDRVLIDSDHTNIGHCYSPDAEANAKFIVHSVNTLPKLIDAAKSLIYVSVPFNHLTSVSQAVSEMQKAIKEAEGEL